MATGNSKDPSAEKTGIDIHHESLGYYAICYESLWSQYKWRKYLRYAGHETGRIFKCDLVV